MRLLLLLAFLFIALPATAQVALDVVDEVVPLTVVATASEGSDQVVTWTGSAPAAAFTGVALQGRGRDVRGDVRFGDGPWHALDLYPMAEGTDVFLGGFRDGTVRQGVTITLRLRGVAFSPLDLTVAGVFDGRTNADAAPAPAVAPDAVTSGTPTGRIIPPKVVSRKKWDANAYRGTPAPLPGSSGYQYITIHHTAGPDAVDESQAKSIVKGIQRFHQDTRGWDDIGYQFLMDDAGRIYQGRPYLDGVDLDENQAPTLVRGAHVGGANTGNIGISLLGCYHPAAGAGCRDTVTPATFDSLAVFVAFLAETYNVNPSNIGGHRDFSSTSCPGDNTYKLLGDLEARVREIIRDGNRPSLAQVDDVSPQPTSGDRTRFDVSWTSTAESGIAEYRLLRATDLSEGQYVTVDSAPAQGTGTTYTLTDPLDGCYSELTYRIQYVGTDGREELGPASSVTPPPVGTATLQAAAVVEGMVTLDGTITADNGLRALALLRDSGGRTDTVYTAASAAAFAPPALDTAGLTPGNVTYRLVGEDALQCTNTLASVAVAVETPESYALASSFPNPFTHQTTIRYYLEQDGEVPVRLDVYDTTGRLVATLVDTYQAGERWYAADFDATDLPSGVYVYRLRVQGFSGQAFEKTETLVLVR